MSLTAFVALQNLAGGFDMLEKNVHFLPILSVEISFAQFAITTCEKEMKCIKK
jgi:hypothetical protein